LTEKTEVDASTFDKRTIDRYIRSGAIDEKTWEKHLKGLADMTEKAAPVETISEEDLDDDLADDTAE
jgi:hypothetical protein